MDSKSFKLINPLIIHDYKKKKRKTNVISVPAFFRFIKT